jgi:F420-non-reducing hydrogenase iron-sulfur subunit
MESMSDLNEITMFVCTNCARPGKELTSSGRARPAVPDFGLPGPVEQVLVPCTGRLQPEHVLRAFETGSRIVSVIACREDNCHYAEGSRRCALRVDSIRSILKEIGLGDDRLLLSYLPGSASEDLAVAVSGQPGAKDSDVYAAQVAAVRAQVMEALQSLPPNPLRVLDQEESMCDKTEATRALSEVGGDE